MIKPGVQYPHCAAPLSRNFSCKTCSLSPCASPSIVSTLRPCICAASNKQLFATTPSTSLVVISDDKLKLALLGLFAQGHLLLEDLPGVGKTLLAKTISSSLDGVFSRIQFTPDLLPSDITGTSVFDLRNQTFEYVPGPIFANVVVADELNRAGPRTQSALLEAMAEGQVSADGKVRLLPRPFFTIATQNLVETHGTFPLPNSQMDRFMVSCGRWFVRFAWLFALSLPLYWLVHRLVNTHLALALDDVLETVNDERTGLILVLARTFIFLILFDLVTLVADYSRVHAVVRLNRSMLSSLRNGILFVLRHPIRVGTLEFLGIVLQAAALALYLPVDDLFGRTTAGSLIAGLVASQAFLLVRLFIRESSRAGQVALYRSLAVHNPE